MQQTKAANYDKVNELPTKKCPLCELDKYQSSFQYLLNNTLIEVEFCKSCRNKLKREKRITEKVYRNISLL